MVWTNFIFFLSGAVTMIILDKVRNFLRHTFQIAQHRKIFMDVLDQIISEKTVFINRINNHVTLGMKIKVYGKITLFYDIDQRILAISKDDNVVLLSVTLYDIFPDLIDNICDNIESRWRKQIEDVVDMNGIIVNKEYIENAVKKNLEDEGLMGITFTISPEHNPSKVDHDTPGTQMTMDDILDKINTSGMESLTQEEKELLERYGKR